MKPFTVSGLLRAAASYIEIHGHEQRVGGGMGKNTGPCCPLAAIRRLGMYHQQGPARSSLMFRMHPRDSVASWSDRTPTAEVLATMRRVARELDGA